MRDLYLPLIAPSTQTASTVGTPVDLLKGTNVEKDSRPGVDLLGPIGLGVDIVAAINVSNIGGTATPTAVFTLNQSDDNITYTPLSALNAIPATTNGDYQIRFNPTKRYVRLDTTITGTTPSFTIDAYVGTIAF